MRTWITRIYVAALCLTASAVSCTKDTGGSLSEDGKPMSFTAGKFRPASGSSVSGSWDGISSVAVKVGGDVKEYSVSVTGGTAVFSCDRPFFWKSLEMAVEAWWPVDAADIASKPDVLVRADQDSEEALNASDFIEASGTVSFGTPRLDFRHRTAKVTVTLVPGEDIAEEDIADAELSILTCSEGVEGGATSCKAFRTQSGAFTALLPSQTVPAGAAFMTANVGELKYVFRPSAPATLEAGKEYSYKLTVKKAGLEPVAAPDITDWGEDETGHGGGAVQILDLSATTGNGIIEVRDKKGLLIIGRTTERVHIIKSSVTLRDVEITGGIVTEGDVTLSLAGRNIVSTPEQEESDPWAHRGSAGIYPKKGSTLTITGDGYLDASSGFGGAGIGGGSGVDSDAGNIRIEGGEIFAIGGAYSIGGAGIGGGTGGVCGDITISGGSVNAIAYDGAGIGGGDSNGNCGSITITGGLTYARSLRFGAGIGGGRGATCGDITISGGEVQVQSDFDGGAAIGAGQNRDDIKSDCGKITIGPGITSVYAILQGTLGSGKEIIGSWEQSTAKSVTIDSSLKETKEQITNNVCSIKLTPNE